PAPRNLPHVAARLGGTQDVLREAREATGSRLRVLECRFLRAVRTLRTFRCHRPVEVPEVGSAVERRAGADQLLWYQQNRVALVIDRQLFPYGGNEPEFGGMPDVIYRSPSKDRKSTRLNSSHSQISYAV